MIQPDLWNERATSTTQTAFMVAATEPRGGDVDYLTIDGRRGNTEDFWQALELAFRYCEGKGPDATAMVQAFTAGEDMRNVAFFTNENPDYFRPWHWKAPPKEWDSVTADQHINESTTANDASAERVTPPDGNQHPNPGEAAQ